MNYYEILEVSENASEEVIKMAYKALAKKYHPDTYTGNPNTAEEKMKELNTAYSVLSNYEKRKEYDAFLKSKRTQNNHYTNQNASMRYSSENHSHKETEVARSKGNRFTARVLIGCLALLAVIAIGLLLLSIGDGNTPIANKMESSSDIMQSIGIETNVVDSREGNGPSVGVRTVTFETANTAEMIYNLWQFVGETEDYLIDQMDEYGASQGGGQLYLIEQGDFVDAIDAWCFDPSRRVGDCKIIKNEYGYSLCYISWLSDDFNTTRNSEKQPAAEPLSGEVLSGIEGIDSEITITTSSSSACIVKLKSRTGNTLLSFYVRANDTVTVGVPAEYLYVYFASGDTWYGKEHLFGDKTYYSMDDEIADFTQYTYEYTLYPVSSGNFSQTPIDASDF